jgi:acid ceramidase
MEQPYRDELKGLANATGVPLGEIVLYNVFYEVFSVCTSIIAQDNNNTLYHGRNLDFGLFLGWNPKTHDWATTELLRTLIINLEWTRNGKVLYKSANFAGYTGIFSAIKPNKFSITINERFNLVGGYVGIIKWLLGMSDGAQFSVWLTRSVLEKAESYDEAREMLRNSKVLSPVYYIVGGNSSGQGTIIVRSLDKVVEERSLDLSKPNGWYVLQTNYDPSEAPLFLDDRRTPGNKCMVQLGRKNVGFEGIYNVLSSKTNMNKLTAYTVIMQVNTNRYENYVRKCKDPCWPF